MKAYLVGVVIATAKGSRTFGYVVDMPDSYSPINDSPHDAAPFPQLRKTVEKHRDEIRTKGGLPKEETYGMMIISVSPLGETVSSLQRRVSEYLQANSIKHDVNMVIGYLPDKANDLNDGALYAAISEAVNVIDGYIINKEKGLKYNVQQILEMLGKPCKVDVMLPLLPKESVDMDYDTLYATISDKVKLIDEGKISVSNAEG